MSTQVGVRDAKMHLSKYLKLVKNGEEVILTERGCPIGKIVPIEKKELPLEARLRLLEESGRLEAKKEPEPIPPPIPVRGKDAQQYLREDREG